MSKPKRLLINKIHKDQESGNEVMSMQFKKQVKAAIINNLGLIFNEYINEIKILKKRSSESGDYEDER